MHRLVKSRLACIRQRRRRQHADRACQHRGLVREDVAEQIVCEDDVKAFWLTHQLHRAGIRQHVVKRHAHIFQLGVIKRLNFLFPEQAGVHDIGFLYRADTAPFATKVSTALRDIKRNARDAVDFRCRVFCIVKAAARTIRQCFNAFRLAEIHTANQLAHDQDIKSLNQLALQRRGIRQSRKAERRTQVGIGVEPFTKAQKASFRTVLTLDAIPFRAADRTHQDSTGGFGTVQRVFCQRRAVFVIARTADGAVFKVQIRRDFFCHANCLFDDFRTNTVTWKKKKCLAHSARLSVRRNTNRL